MLLHIIFLLSICTFCHWMWLLPLLLLFWLLGWLFEWFKRQTYLDRITELERENSRLSIKSTDLEKELGLVKYDLEKSNADRNAVKSRNADLEIKLRSCNEQRTNLETQLAIIEENTINLDAENTSSLGFLDGGSIEDNSAKVGTEIVGIGSFFSENDLQIIEGIGPKIEGLLKAAGFNTWNDVGNASVDDLSKILEHAGSRYRVHNPKTWPDQARLAANGDWDALTKYQKMLDNGKENPNTVGETPSKLEKLYAKKIGFAAFKPNDLKIVEGIGPKIESLLHQAGITTWAELAATSVERIQEILSAAGDRYRLANPTTWPKQAAFAADGKWVELKSYQDFLDSGRG